MIELGDQSKSPMIEVRSKFVFYCSFSTVSTTKKNFDIVSTHQFPKKNFLYCLLLPKKNFDINFDIVSTHTKEDSDCLYCVSVCLYHENV